MLLKLRTFLTYLLGKKSEIKRLNRNDALMAKVVLDIHRKRTHSEFIPVPLHAVLPIHPIDRGEALASMERRVRILETNRGALAGGNRITRDFLARHIPSVSAIKVVALGDGCYVSYEGNGRLAALQRVFRDRPDMEVEVELYHFLPQDGLKMLRRIKAHENLHPG